MSDHATTMANAVARLNSGDVDGYIEGLYHPHCRFQLPDTFGSDRRGDLGWSDALRSGAVEVTGAEPLRRALPRWFTRSAFATVPRPNS